MEILQKRIETFQKPRRVKSTLKSSVLIKWPHPSDFVANPQSLAEAGFYFDPSYGDKDSVTCFMCEKQLSDWEADDDPFDIHFEKCGRTCSWAILRCGLRIDMDTHGNFIFPDKTRIPTAKAIEKARLQTFAVGDGWVHDQNKNHGANSKKMARSGFIYTPQHPGDDLATCLYCNISLSGWDEGDDPMEEHQTRQAKQGLSCPLFPPSTTSTPPDTSVPSKPPSRSQSAKPPSKSSKRSSRSESKTTKHLDVLMPTKTHDGGDSDMDQDILKPTRILRKGRSTSNSRASTSSKAPQSKTRSSSRTGLRNVNEDVEEGNEEAEKTVPVVEPPPQSKPRLTRAKSKSVLGSTAPEPTTEGESETLRKSTRAKPRAPSQDSAEKVIRKSSRSTKPRPTVIQEDEEPKVKAKVKPEAIELQKKKQVKVVEISTDEEDDAKGVVEPATKKEDKQDIVVEVEHPPMELEQNSPPPPQEVPSLATPEIQPPASTSPLPSSYQDEDVDMDETNQEITEALELPKTPRPTIAATQTPPPQPSNPSPQPNSNPNPKTQTPEQSLPPPSTNLQEEVIIPILSKLPFVPLQTLSEAELDMTVEEWIRYQMEVEYDKFRRDGERELQRFRKRAEDVRRVIEGL